MPIVDKPNCPSCRIALVREEVPPPAEVEKRFRCKTCGFLFEVRASGGAREPGRPSGTG